MENGSSAIATYRAVFAHAHQLWMEGTVGDVTPEEAAWQPPGRLATIGGLYAHVALAEDLLLAHALGQKPLLASSHAGQTGVDILPPAGDWHAWSHAVTVDLPTLRAYAAAVTAATDARLAAMTDADLTRMADLNAIGYGEMPMAQLLLTLSTHIAVHAGEVSAVKGLMGRKGYPL